MLPSMIQDDEVGQVLEILKRVLAWMAEAADTMR